MTGKFGKGITPQCFFFGGGGWIVFIVVFLCLKIKMFSAILSKIVAHKYVERC